MIKNRFESVVLIRFVLFENEAFSSNVQSGHFKLYRVMRFHLECGLALNDVMNFHWSECYDILNIQIQCQK